MINYSGFYINDQINIDYRFDIMMDDNAHIINKASGLVNVTFNILQEAELDNPNIRVSLYQKDQLTTIIKLIQLSIWLIMLIRHLLNMSKTYTM